MKNIDFKTIGLSVVAVFIVMWLVKKYNENQAKMELEDKGGNVVVMPKVPATGTGGASV